MNMNNNINKNTDIAFIIKKEGNDDDKINFIDKISDIIKIKNKNYFLSIKTYYKFSRDEYFYIVELQKAKSKFYLLKTFISAEVLRKLVGRSFDYNSDKNFEKIKIFKEFSNYLAVKRFKGFNQLIIRPKKHSINNQAIVSYLTVNNSKREKSINTKKLNIKKTVISKTFRIRNLFMILNIINNNFEDHLIIQIYIPKFKRQYQGKILFNHITEILKDLLNKRLLKESEFDFLNIKNKRKFCLNAIKKHFNIIFDNFEIYTQRYKDNLFKIWNYVGILQEILSTEILKYEDNPYYFEITFDIKDCIFQNLSPININNNYSPNFLIKIKPLKCLGLLNFKISLVEFIKFVNYKKTGTYNLADLHVVTKYIMTNFTKFWDKVNCQTDACSFSDLLYTHKYKLSTVSAIHLKHYPITLKKPRYPVLLIQKPFTLKPKQICIIFLESKDLIKVIIYNLQKRQSNNFYFRIDLLRGIFGISEYLIHMNLLEQAGNRIYKIVKNRYLFKNMLRKH